jgi:hypothetical protein
VVLILLKRTDPLRYEEFIAKYKGCYGPCLFAWLAPLAVEDEHGKLGEENIIRHVGRFFSDGGTQDLSGHVEAKMTSTSSERGEDWGR